MRPIRSGAGLVRSQWTVSIYTCWAAHHARRSASPGRGGLSAPINRPTRSWKASGAAPPAAVTVTWQFGPPGRHLGHGVRVAPCGRQSSSAGTALTSSSVTPPAGHHAVTSAHRRAPVQRSQQHTGQQRHTLPDRLDALRPTGGSQPARPAAGRQPVASARRGAPPGRRHIARLTQSSGAPPTAACRRRCTHRARPASPQPQPGRPTCHSLTARRRDGWSHAIGRPCIARPPSRLQAAGAAAKAAEQRPRPAAAAPLSADERGAGTGCCPRKAEGGISGWNVGHITSDVLRLHRCHHLFYVRGV